MDARHNLVQTLVDLLGCPRHAHGVLCHLQTAGGHTTGIDGLAWGKELACGDELIDGFGRTTHVRHLSHTEWFVGQYHVGIVSIELVLCSTGQVDVGLLLPRLLVGEEGGSLELLLVGLAHIVA